MQNLEITRKNIEDESNFNFIKTSFHVNSSPSIIVSLIPSVASSSLSRIEEYRGLIGCRDCNGDGVLKSGKACRICVRRTGNCNVCKNTGVILNIPGKKCKCIWGNSDKLLKN